MDNVKIKIGIIGGSGLDDPEILDERSEALVVTQFGKPSDALISGKVRGVDCILLARHGRKHTISPSYVNYRANLCALKDAGCTHVLVTTLCGSLKEEIKPGDFVVLDQFYDKTFRRNHTLFDNSAPEYPGVYHVPMNDPFCPEMRKLLVVACKKLGYSCHESGITVTVEGPRFSTRAESLAHKQLGFDVVGMTTATECMIANELGLCYASLAIVTDYDCWRDAQPDAQPVSVKFIESNALESAPRAQRVLEETVEAIGALGLAGWKAVIESRHNAVSKSRFDKANA